LGSSRSEQRSGTHWETLRGYRAKEKTTRPARWDISCSKTIYVVKQCVTVAGLKTDIPKFGKKRGGKRGDMESIREVRSEIDLSTA